MRHEKSYGSVTITFIDRAEAVSRLRGIAARIRAEHADVCDVRLVGSLARGDQTGESDIDLLIVLQGDVVRDPLERTRALYACFDLPIGVDLLLIAEADLLHRLERGDTLFQEMWSESLSLLGP